jgi:O-antigen/teichoic acid export membrane protein
MSVSKNAKYSILTQIPTQIFGIISGIFITRILGAEGRGLYAIYYADISLFTTLLDFSIITALIYFTASKKITESKIIGIASVFSILTVLLTF